LRLVFATRGPMPSGLPTGEKARMRALCAQGKVDRQTLLDAEIASYHSPGTCTFYGTANSSQVMMELMGLHVPGAAFVNPGTPLRDALTAEATRRAAALARAGEARMADGVDGRAVVNRLVARLATRCPTHRAIH